MGIKNLFFLLSIISLSNSAISEPANKKPSGLTLKLIHRDSIESNNLTRIEKFRKTIHRSKLRANYLMCPTGVTQGKLGASLTYESSIYVVDTYPGTPPSVNGQYLILDTAAELTWLQCDGCINCFKQKQRLYNPHKSHTYELLPCDHPLCNPYECNHNHCKFKEWDSPDVHVEGFMGKDTFGFPHSGSGSNFAVVDGVVFGCAYGTVGFGFEADPANGINGVFGLGPGRRSFLSQFAPQGVFGYCLADWHFGPPDYPGHLLFGDDALLPVSDLVRTTPIVEQDPRNYYLKLMDIGKLGSTTNETLGFERGKFDRVHDPERTYGGFIIDSGTAISYFASDVYDRLRQEFVDYMRTLGLPEMDASSYQLDLCWEMPNGLPDNLPSMILYFEDHEYDDRKAEMVIDKYGLFHIEEKEENPHLCLGIMRNDGTVDPDLNILGAKQQTGNKFLYDRTNKTVSWMKWACELPPTSPPSN